jgi:MFS family permease
MAQSKFYTHYPNILYFSLGTKVNAMFYVGFSIASLLGVVLNNTVVPLLGWSAIFSILGLFTLISIVLLMFFHTERTIFIPFSKERPLYKIKGQGNQIYQMENYNLGQQYGGRENELFRSRQSGSQDGGGSNSEYSDSHF